ncbi:unnamed protein product [Dicrocoelium dendriticum]|nr:unnamed protein product [Dicrocoelium dendriticum]
MVLLQSSTVSAVNSLDNHHSTSTPHSCLRGSQCPSHYYLTTELVKPGTIYANVAETFTTVLPVCRPCHQLCNSCSSASVVRAGPHHLGCITCTAVWFRGACVEECPSKDTYSIVVRRIPVWNVSSTNTSATHSEWPNTTRVAHPHSDVSQVFFTRQVSGHCLACDPMCHTGCWGPNPGQCKHCLHSRVHLSILPQSMLRFRPEWTEQLNEASSQQSSNVPIPTHAVQARFVCVSRCPAELPFVVQDPTTGDHLCHHETVLSAKHVERIKEENALTFAMSGISLTSFDFMSTSDSTTGHTGNIFMWLMLTSVATILCTLIICLWRAHQRKWKRYYWKRTFEPSSDGGFPGDSYTWSCIHATKYSLSACGANSAAHPGRRSETLEMGLLSKGKEAQNHGGTFANQTALDGTQTTRSSKAPNLGRLVMIQSDDLILDEQYGPLGTGAFGAVYRGVWRVVDPDAIGDQSAASTAIGTRSDSMHSSATLWTTAPTPSEDEKSDRPLLVSPTCPSAANTPNFRQPPSYRMVHVAVKILNEVRGSSDLHALLDEAKVCTIAGLIRPKLFVR